MRRREHILSTTPLAMPGKGDMPASRYRQAELRAAKRLDREGVGPDWEWRLEVYFYLEVIREHNRRIFRLATKEQIEAWFTDRATHILKGA